MNGPALLTALTAIVGEDGVRTDDAACALAASDVHVNGARPLAVVRPGDAAQVAAVVAAAVGHGHAVLPRGGGLSYTGGYAPPHARSISVDMRGMNRILAIAPDDMVMTVEAGVTWKQMAAALRPLGLRLPFIGTFSGAGATVGGGTGFVPPGHFSLHLTAAGRCAAAVRGDLRAARAIAVAAGGKPVAPTIPRVARAALFADLDGLLGPTGGRWAALNAKVAHSDAQALIAAFDAMLAPHLADMAAHGVTCTRLASALADHCFSFEPVFHWRDSWQPIHRALVSEARLASMTEPPPNAQARALVDRLRGATVTLFREFGAASNQIGRAYPFREALSPAPEALLADIKAALDPRGLINPGVLGF